MAKQPGDRYPEAGAMRDDLCAALRMPEEPRRPGPGRR